jgi:uncharacterized protein
VVVDTGIASHLLGLTDSRLAKQPAAFGPLLENFVLGELARQLTWSDVRAELFHCRTRMEWKWMAWSKLQTAVSSASR